MLKFIKESQGNCHENNFEKKQNWIQDLNKPTVIKCVYQWKDNM